MDWHTTHRSSLSLEGVLLPPPTKVSFIFMNLRVGIRDGRARSVKDQLLIHNWKKCFQGSSSPHKELSAEALKGNDLRISKRSKDEGGCVRTTNLNNIMADQRGQSPFIHIYIIILLYYNTVSFRD